MGRGERGEQAGRAYALRSHAAKQEEEMAKQGQWVLVKLRQMIMSGDLAPGTRIAEIPLSEQLGVSRTPVRLAFRTLEQEGLLQREGRRGFSIRKVGEKEIRDAVEVRGVLEGLAARLVAEQGLSKKGRAVLLECLEKGDTLFSKGTITEEDMSSYHDLNMVFHQTLIDLADNSALSLAVARNNHLPFASYSSIAVDLKALDREFMRLKLAHMQHHILVDALERGQGARAEAVMREHAYAGALYFEMFWGNRRRYGDVTFITAAAE